MDKNNQWFLLSKESQLKRLQILLKEHPIIEIGQMNSYVLLGYKIISPKEKETYYFLKEMAQFSQSKTGKDEINVSLDYISKSLGTSIRTQIRRIEELEKVRLISRIKRKFKNNLYKVNLNPLPDSTFMNTLIVLIRRKRLLNLISEYKGLIDPRDKKNVVNKIKDNIENPRYKDIVVDLPDIPKILEEEKFLFSSF